ncbi:MAG: NADH-quinone oxidoreductase subunit NuoE [Candidatus Marinimicrobia bacterium]|nr:NADH-quinone oxidoreductase subunit NuoE [Candidatus Neomarinimicrobiota bacterium]
MLEVVSKTKKLIDKHGREESVLIPLLQDVQTEYGYVPKDSINIIAEELLIYPVEIYGVLTFYSQFKLNKPGKHTIRVCQGTACHVMGGKVLLDNISDKLGIEDGETTEDGLFSIERVACLGTCGMAPVVAIDEKFYGNVQLNQVDDILNKYRESNEK